MSVSSSRDPVQVIIDILNDTGSGDWSNSSNGKPSVIERTEAREKKLKHKEPEGNDAAYVYRPDQSQVEQVGAEFDKQWEIHTVNIDFWTKTSATQAHNLRLDWQQILLADYARETSSGKTNFNYIEPKQHQDLRPEKAPQQADVYRILVPTDVRGVFTD